jgi:hypothetical protein
MVGSEHVRGRNMDDAANSGVACCLEGSRQLARFGPAKAEAASGRDGLGREHDHLDADDRVGEGLIVGVGVELDHRDVGGQSARHVTAEELPSAYDQVQTVEF